MNFPVNTKFNTLRRRQSRLFQSYLLPAWITSDSRSAVTTQHLDVNQLSAPAPTPCWVPATAPACILETPNGAVHVNTIPSNLNSKPVSGVFTHTAMIASVRVGHEKHEATKKLPHWCMFQLPMIKGKRLLEILKNCGWQHHLKTLCNSFLACFRTTLILGAQPLAKLCSPALLELPLLRPHTDQKCRVPAMFSHSGQNRVRISQKGRLYCWYPYLIWLVGKQVFFQNIFHHGCHLL